MEKLDLYDRQGNVLGQTINRDESVPKDAYILIVILLVKDDLGRWLVQKRSLDKRISPGLWAFTAGTVQAGENGGQGILREVREELGLSLKKQALQCVGKYVGESFLSELWLFKGNLNLSDMVLQTSEVIEVTYMSIEDIRQGIAKGSFHDYSDDLLNFLETL